MMIVTKLQWTIRRAEKIDPLKLIVASIGQSLNCANSKLRRDYFKPFLFFHTYDVDFLTI
jgi:hypothetical protein